MSRNLLLLLLFLIILIGFIGFFGLYEVKLFSSRASIKSITFSVDNSYIFITPLRAGANGQEKIRVTIFVLDEQGLGVMGKKVYIDRDEALNIEEIQALTDNFGKAYFDVTSTKIGEYYLKVLVDNVELKQKAHLSFY